MATRCCQYVLPASSPVLSGLATSFQQEAQSPALLRRGMSPILSMKAPLVSPSCGCSYSVRSKALTRDMCVRASMSNSRASDSNHQDFWNVRESEAASDGAELDEMLAASDPASCWEQDDEAALDDAYDDENSPAHWIQEWAENKERDMHRAAEMAYSVFSEGACCTGTNHSLGTSLLMGLGFALCFGALGLGVSDAAAAVEVAAGNPEIGNMAAILADEPANALSLPTWVIHVASVVEWITAISLVWRYGDSEEPGRRAWKGLAWGMLPLLAGALCACTWHFFYNAPSLEGIVALQGFFTVLGNCTLWWAAFRIYQQAQKPAAS